MADSNVDGKPTDADVVDQIGAVFAEAQARVDARRDAPCSDAGIYESQNINEVCDTCSGQEGLHYCLVRTEQVKNMNIMTCEGWAPMIPNG